VLLLWNLSWLFSDGLDNAASSLSGVRASIAANDPRVSGAGPSVGAGAATDKQGGCRPAARGLTAAGRSAGAGAAAGRKHTKTAQGGQRTVSQRAGDKLTAQIKESSAAYPCCVCLFLLCCNKLHLTYTLFLTSVNFALAMCPSRPRAVPAASAGR